MSIFIFLVGPSFFSATTPASQTDLGDFFKPNYRIEDYHPSGASNIDRLVNILAKNGAVRAPADASDQRNLLQTFFGRWCLQWSTYGAHYLMSSSHILWRKVRPWSYFLWSINNIVFQHRQRHNFEGCRICINWMADGHLPCAPGMLTWYSLHLLYIDPYKTDIIQEQKFRFRLAFAVICI